MFQTKSIVNKKALIYKNNKNKSVIVSLKRFVPTENSYTATKQHFANKREKTAEAAEETNQRLK